MASEGTTAGTTRSPWIRRCGAAAWRFVRAAPGTCVYLLILGANTFALVQMSPRFRKYFLFSHRTNLIELRHHPIKVLISSAFWTATPSFAYWLPLFLLFHVPVERWLGTLRWLAVVAIAHILATLVSEGTVAVMISMGRLPLSTRHTIDIGVSYGLSGSVGVLTWFFARPLRWWYLGATTAFFALLFTVAWDFTNLGHLTAFLLGVACYPVTRDVPGGNWRPHRRSRARSDADGLSPLRSGATG